jgi:hypothetical protein
MCLPVGKPLMDACACAQFGGRSQRASVAVLLPLTTSSQHPFSHSKRQDLVYTVLHHLQLSQLSHPPRYHVQMRFAPLLTPLLSLAPGWPVAGQSTHTACSALNLGASSQDASSCCNRSWQSDSALSKRAPSYSFPPPSVRAQLPSCPAGCAAAAARCPALRSSRRTVPPASHSP